MEDAPRAPATCARSSGATRCSSDTLQLRFGPRGTRIAFDVGRYDAYGVYRFDALVALALEQPDPAALAPLVADADDAIEIDPASETKRGPRP